jgi:hypothetical protein
VINLSIAKKNVALLKREIRKEGKLFYMSTWVQKTPCGTVQCIGGTAEYLFFTRAEQPGYVGSEAVFVRLFGIVGLIPSKSLSEKLYKVRFALFFPTEVNDPLQTRIWSEVDWTRGSYSDFDALPARTRIKHACKAIDNTLAYLIELGVYNA